MSDEQGVNGSPASSDEVQSSEEKEAQEKVTGEVDIQALIADNERLSDEKKGLISDTAQERERRRSAESQVQFYRDMQTQPQQSTEESVEYVADLTLADLDRLIEKKAQSIAQPITQQNRTAILSQQEDAMRHNPKYPDYDDVIDNIVKPMMAQDADFKNMLGLSNNPALTAYNWAMSQPQYAQQKTVASTKKALREIDANANKTNLATSGGGSGASKTPAPGNKYKGMSSAEIKKLGDDIMSGKV